MECGLRFAASKRPASYFGKLSVNHIQWRYLLFPATHPI
jgi:hypothetical protein